MFVGLAFNLALKLKALLQQKKRGGYQSLLSCQLIPIQRIGIYNTFSPTVTIPCLQHCRFKTHLLYFDYGIQIFKLILFGNVVIHQ